MVQHQLDQLLRSVQADHPDTPVDRLRLVIEHAYGTWDRAPVQSYRLILTERAVRRLLALEVLPECARAGEGQPTKVDAPCTGIAGETSTVVAAGWTPEAG